MVWFLAVALSPEEVDADAVMARLEAQQQAKLMVREYIIMIIQLSSLIRMF